MKRLLSVLVLAIISLSLIAVPVQAQVAQTAKNTISAHETVAVVKYVYIAKAGKKYHNKGCSYLKNGSTKIKLTVAKSKGYTPCSRCKPPTK